MKATLFKQQQLNSLYESYSGCNGCHFKMPSATQVVFGEGNPDAQIMLIGEAPGKEEDIQGKPFVGRSGKLLNRIFETIGIHRSDIFITNIVKCRPPNNRRPTPLEIAQNKPLLLDQIKIIQPKVICTLGSSALTALIDQDVKITQMRGKKILWHEIPTVPTFHPAYILRNPRKLPILMDDLSFINRIKV